MKQLPDADKARALWRWFMGLSAIWIGLGYAIGPPLWYRSPTLFVVNELPIPVPVWGWLMILAGALVLTRWRSVGHFLALVVFGLWSAFVVVNAALTIIGQWIEWMTGEYPLGVPVIASWGGDALFLTVALIHAHQLLAPVAVKQKAETSDPWQQSSDT